MGLLDQIIGQVIGGMTGGGRAAPSPGGGPATGGRPGPAGPAGGGGLGGMLGGTYSPLVMALLALLASRHMSTGAGGYGSILHDIFGRVLGGGRGGSPSPDEPGRFGPGSEPDESDGYPGDGPEDGYGDDGPPPSRGRRGRYEPENMGEDGPPWQGGPGGYGGDEGEMPPFGRGRRGGGSPGGFLDEVGSMLDGPGRGGGDARGVTGGGLDDMVGSGLDGLVERFQQNGRGDLIQSWVGSGPNATANPSDLAEALGPGTVDELSRRTGLDRDELLGQLSHALPQVVDGLTPGGHVPSADEQRGWV